MYIYKNTQSIDAIDKLQIDMINTIPNGSVKNIFCDCIDGVPFEKRHSIQNELLHKLSIGGQITICMINTRLLCKNLYLDKISYADLNNALNRIESLGDPMELYSSVPNNYKVIKQKTEQLLDFITIERLS
jgi:hypothetical protein